jgi:hypothetical protein
MIPTSPGEAQDCLRCERCGHVFGADAVVASVEGEVEGQPDPGLAYLTLTGVICEGCWVLLGRALSSTIYRGRILLPEDTSPLDMRPLESAPLSDPADLEQEQHRAASLKRELNRIAVLTFHDPWSKHSVVVHREEWDNPVQVAVAMVTLLRELRDLRLAEVDTALERAGVQFPEDSSPSTSTQAT